MPSQIAEIYNPFFALKNIVESLRETIMKAHAVGDSMVEERKVPFFSTQAPRFTNDSCKS